MKNIISNDYESPSLNSIINCGGIIAALMKLSLLTREDLGNWSVDLLQNVRIGRLGLVVKCHETEDVFITQYLRSCDSGCDWVCRKVQTPRLIGDFFAFVLRPARTAQSRHLTLSELWIYSVLDMLWRCRFICAHDYLHSKRCRFQV